VIQIILFQSIYDIQQGSATYSPPSKIIRPTAPLQIVVIAWPAWWYSIL